MWITDDGRINTVAIPGPTDVMTKEFARRDSMAAWRRTKREGGGWRADGWSRPETLDEATSREDIAERIGLFRCYATARIASRKPKITRGHGEHPASRSE